MLLETRVSLYTDFGRQTSNRLRMEHVIGIDVGTGSVRAALVTKDGTVLAVSYQPITAWNPKPDYYIQSSEDIWSACCTVIKVVSQGVPKESIKGIGFDATCSLVVLDKNGGPLSVYPEGDDNQNIILWMDHRAVEETEFINNTEHPVLRFTGGKISCEMVMPKLLWLKNHMYEQCWNKAGHFMLLPDFLTWKATRSELRSLCSLVCKETYVASPSEAGGWDSEFIDIIGMRELCEDNFKRIGSISIKPGEKCGTLTETAARELDLCPETAVGSSLIDAHAGGLALMGCKAPGIKDDFVSKVALICGTSTCHMIVSNTELYVPGVWGPYYNAMVPDMWLIEGGQSASGKLVDHIVETHPAYPGIRSYIGENENVTVYLNNVLEELRKKCSLESIDVLTNDVHVYPDFHGNRSPISDPTLRGMVSGLSLAADEKDLAVLYLATLQALVYSTKHILQEVRNAGHENFGCLLLCGGLSRNKLFLQLHANAIGIHVLSPQEPEMVLVGAAMLGASAANLYPSLKDAILNMASTAIFVEPDGKTAKFHEKKYRIFLEMLKHQMEYRNIANEE